jgi:hypothetical protein
MGCIRWIDRNLWSVPVLVFLATGLAFGVWAMASSKPMLLAAAPVTTRQAVYTSLTGSASAFFGVSLAVVAILVVFPRLAASNTEQALARARTTVVGVLLAASFFMVMVVVIATIGIAVDVERGGNTAITTLLEASGFASVVGLLVGGCGLVLVIVERSRQ